ncbi:uncharacterized protein LOC124298446 isoform X1 [Neodiprion virginianus]|uniref:uncharacterized protein LOC124175206 isoform X1 n=1 Tax=Neodiprion fabricii TaxID=2872261 RepID=UPI001ED90F2A|nr:uncharacterized protein LOC124175206 isoform X1 [Neodiprion fabricii]XP_046411166.1 uncharacterized protein LOC124175206 isoform X1 [Neodiprion fabricii]XP_046411167.1 uncharacterized protein LOC124175206 isoform X1 [Neodiprion fabricii]XP_046606421.1 uncharacterized protein LOC124298446 isoform X1 [Neodiprion virginianus]XP_046606422.1 uncharacterized protein LOC124298446 isoform X1 [Neodiprion virginianus]XP_046606423.1 uncharacterized protein LOC124298446 isoform X1 [Neodiprion virginian
MARAGTQRWRNPTSEGDDVQRSIELLDKVLSEYDENEAEGDGGAGSGGGNCGSSTEPSIGLTPDDESPSLGHQSEDDGYMSMNGRKAKMALVALRPVPDCPEPQDNGESFVSEFPPPPEEAERLISTLLPMVSPSNSAKRNSQSSSRKNGRQQWMAAMEDHKRHGHVATTQTTLPKTRHQRPYGWENGIAEPFRLAEPPSPPSKFASLPYDGKVSFNWIPPRTNPGAIEKHREVRRRSSEEVLNQQLTNNRHNIHHGSQDKDRASMLRKQRQNEIVKSSSVEDRLLMNRNRSESEARRRNNSDSSEGRFSRNSESERSSIPRSSSVSVERFSVRANCDSSDFSRANSTSNERFHSDFSIAVASVSSNDHASVPTSDPFSIRNLDFSFSLPRAESAGDERFSGRTSDRCSDQERYSDMFSTRNSDFSTRNSTDFRTQSEEEHFSDDSLEELLPPPPPIGKRHSIAWEVSLEDDPLYAPGSTKVVGRRRRKSSDVSSVGSASKMRDFDDWPDPPLSATEDDLVSPYSDSSTNDLDQIRPQDLTKNGTYVIRRGRKKERKLLPKTPTKTKSLSFDNCEEARLPDAKRYSSTFDNIKSLLKEGRLEGLDEPPPDFTPPLPPELVRVVSLPVINNESGSRAQLEMTVEEEETSSDISDKDKSEIKKKSLGVGNFGGEIRPVLVTLDALETDQRCNGPASAISMSKSMDAKIPVNLLIEDQIVKKALNENRRQLEKVSDAIKEIENVRNSESYEKRRRNAAASSDTKSNSKRNSYESSNDDKKVIDNPFDNRPRKQNSSDSETSKTSSSEAAEFDRRKTNGSDVYSAGRRIRQNGNDQKQIENVIDAILEDSKNPEFQVSVEVLEFPPLPPSPVEEADEESSDVGVGVGVSVTTKSSKTLGNGSSSNSSNNNINKAKSHGTKTVDYRPRVPPHRAAIDAKDGHVSSLNTRSMDAGFSRGRRTAAGSGSRREVPVERRTLPTDLPGPSRRRPFAKWHSPSAEPSCPSPSAGTTVSGMQTSCSLPETPVFARGSDIPRTPQHAGNPGQQTRRQPGWYAPTTATTGYRRNNVGLEQAIIGTELLRLAGGPNRGWYPTRKGNQPRPASIEHLERLNNLYDARLPGGGEQQRKPLTLPTNITPNKYFGQSKHSSASSTREALRRVTSLLIKKGGNSKDNKVAKDISPSGHYPGGESSDAPKKKGFFKSFWKRSRHYSLENQ